MRGVRGGLLMGPREEPRLPPGYRLDRSDLDVWVLRRHEGWVVARFTQRLDYSIGIQRSEHVR